MCPMARRVPITIAGLIAISVAGLSGPANAAAARPAAAPAAGGYIRLAHLSPDTPEVDVYLTAFERPDFKVVLRGVGYGAVSPYQPAVPGRYTVSMRLAGAAESTPAVLSTNVEVATKGAYTVAGVGKKATLGLRVINDDLTPPPSGQAKVRVLNASIAAPAIDVVGNTRTVLASGAQFTATTGYRAIRSGPWKVVVRPSTGGAELGTDSTEFRAGSVYSLVVLGRGPQVTVTPLQDAAGATVVPVGGMDTGLGGTAGRTPRRDVIALVAVLVLLALGAAGGVRMLPRQGARHRREPLRR